MSHRGYETVTKVAEFISNERFNDDNTQWLVDYLEETHGYQLGAILVQNPGLGRLEPIAMSKQGRDELFVEEDKAFVRSSLRGGLTGITGWVAAAGEAVRSGDVRQDSRYHSLRDNIRSELCVPLKIQGQSMGVINTETSKLNAYDEYDEGLLKIVGVLVAGWLTAKRAGVPDPTVACAWCNKLRTNDRSWQDTPGYLFDNFGVTVSHGICPSCTAAQLKDMKDDS